MSQLLQPDSNECKKTDWNKCEKSVWTQYDELEAQAWIQTYTGAKFNPFLPDPDQVFIEDIAHALANLCRFAGHSREFYSVAQHSVLVSIFCPRELALWGLLHDAAEAYLLDMPRPLKRNWRLTPYRQAEEKLDACIWNKFGFEGKLPPEVKDADLRVWAAECRDLMAPLHPDFHIGVEPIAETIRPLSPAEAKHLFLVRFKLLVGEKQMKSVMGQLTGSGELTEVG